MHLSKDQKYNKRTSQIIGMYNRWGVFVNIAEVKQKDIYRMTIFHLLLLALVVVVRKQIVKFDDQSSNKLNRLKIT